MHRFAIRYSFEVPSREIPWNNQNREISIFPHRPMFDIFLRFFFGRIVFPFDRFREGKWWGEKNGHASMWRNRFCFFFSPFFFSPFFFLARYTRLMGGREERGRVVLSAQLSEHVTIGQGRLNQSGIDTLRPFVSIRPSRALSIAVLFETENLLPYQPIAYTYFPLHVYSSLLFRMETNFNFRWKVIARKITFFSLFLYLKDDDDIRSSSFQDTFELFDKFF